MARYVFNLPTVQATQTVRLDTALGSDSPASGLLAADGTAIGSTLTADHIGFLPEVQGPDGVSTLYVKVLAYGGAVTGTPVAVTGLSQQAAPSSPGGSSTVPMVHLAIPSPGNDSGGDSWTPLNVTDPNSNYSIASSGENLHAETSCGPMTFSAGSGLAPWIDVPDLGGGTLILHTVELLVSNGAGTQKLLLQNEVDLTLSATNNPGNGKLGRYYLVYEGMFSAVQEQIGTDLVYHADFDPINGPAYSVVTSTAGGQYFARLLLTFQATGIV